MSSTSIESTRARTPGDLPQLPAGTHPVFALGSPVPGLNSWVLERKLGGGGFGEVWLARHAWDTDQRPRAVKFCTDPAARHQLVTHEQNVVRRVMKYAGKHPNIVPLLECNLDGETPWLMYEFVEGGTLAGALAQWRKMSPHKRIDLVVQTLHDLAGALGAFHRFDPPLVHRDMKPHNVLMAGGRVPRITDFGIGGIALRPSDATDDGSVTESAARLPSELRAAGTRIYAPQEQLLGSEPHPRDDVYALGIIAYQLLTADIHTAPGTDAAHELRLLRAPDALISLILRSASINPERRPKDATEWEDALAALLHRTHRFDDHDPAATEANGLAPPTDRPAPRTEQLPVAVSPAVAPPRVAPPPSAPAPEPEPAPRAKANARPAIKADWRVWPKSDPVRSKKRRPTNAWVAIAALFVVAGLIACFAYLLPGGSGWGSGRIRGAGSRPGEVREFWLPDGSRMPFCWVPAGETQLGSPKAERELVLKQFNQSPVRVAEEAEEKRGRFSTKGFWMAKYEVTQAEWALLMKGTPIATPSGFRAGGSHAAALGPNPDTRRLPVEGISWNQCQEFVSRANALAERSVGARGKFVLPTEDMWEYAARGGATSAAPFYFGRELNGTQANVDGTAPFGTATRGPNLDRPSEVGTYESKFPHAWGLCDIHGNVWEWCENRYEGTSAHVVRGGSWFNQPHDARSANRNWHAPDARRPDVGMRLCWVID